MGSNNVRTLRIPHQRIGIPAPADDCLFKLFVRKRDSVDIHTLDFVGDSLHLGLVNDIVNIGNTDIRARPAAHLVHLIFQSGVADPSSDQCDVAQQRFREPVTRSAHHPFNGRFIRIARRIGAGVHDDNFSLTFKEKDTHSRQYFVNTLAEQFSLLHLDVGDIFAHKAGQHIRGDILRGEVRQTFQNLIHDNILGEPADA
ncbi:hypothetical protein D3C76_677870 [compost metagenome]